jgi:uncharacterized membrane protein
MSIVVMWVHLLAVIAWMGGMMFVLFVLRPVMGRSGFSSQSGQLLKRIDGRFRTIRWTSIMIILMTGFFNLLYEGGTEKIESGWGVVLLVKILFAAIAMGLTGINDFVLNSPSVHAISEHPTRSSKWLGDIVLVLTLFVLFMAVYLSRS